MALSLFFNFRSEFEQGDQVIVHNIKKVKLLPGTKEAKKYLPLHMSRKYQSRIPVSIVCWIFMLQCKYEFGVFANRLVYSRIH